MQTFVPGQANTLTVDMLAKSNGDSIVSGTVNLYLKATSGANSGKWWKASDGTWSATIVSAGVCSHDDDGHWICSVAAGAWISGVRYRINAKESGGLHVSYSEEVSEKVVSVTVESEVTT
jgi:hypothetical protein